MLEIKSRKLGTFCCLKSIAIKTRPCITKKLIARAIACALARNFGWNIMKNNLNNFVSLFAMGVAAASAPIWAGSAFASDSGQGNQIIDSNQDQFRDKHLFGVVYMNEIQLNTLVGQTFNPKTTILDNFSLRFGLYSEVSVNYFRSAIYEWNTSTGKIANANPLFMSDLLTFPQGTPVVRSFYDFSVDTNHLNLDTNKTYIATMMLDDAIFQSLPPNRTIVFFPIADGEPHYSSYIDWNTGDSWERYDINYARPALYYSQGYGNLYDWVSLLNWSQFYNPSEQNPEPNIYYYSELTSKAIYNFAYQNPSTDMNGDGGVYLTSQLGSRVNPVFAGGTLTFDIDDEISTDFVINPGTENQIDVAGLQAWLSGLFSSSPGEGLPPVMAFFDSVGGGSLVIDGQWGSEDALIGDLINLINLRITQNGHIYANSILNRVGGYIHVDAGGSITDDLTNFGTVVNAGTYSADVNNDGAVANIQNLAGATWYGNILTNINGATIENSGLWYGFVANEATGTITNSGRWRGGFENSGEILNTASGDWRGQFDNKAGGIVTNYGFIFDNTEMTPTNANSGEIDNYGRIQAHIYNHNIINNFAGSIWDGDVLANDGTGQINNDGTWNGDAYNDGTINNNSAGVWTGDLFNYTGTVQNNGIWDGDVSNATDCTINTTGTITGDIVNSGVINASGAIGGYITNQDSGIFTVTGNLTNDFAFTNNDDAQLIVSGGNYIGITSLINNSTNASGIGIATGRTIGATNITNAAGSNIINYGNLNSSYQINNSGNLTSTGSVNGGIINNASGIVLAQGAFNDAITNNGLFRLTGVLTNNGGALNNNATGTLIVGANSFTGLGAITNANGGLISIGTSAINGTLGAASITNSGAITMQNGKTGDRINLSGAYNGNASSIVAMDVNMASNANIGDRIIAASNSGNSTISLQNTGSSKIYFSSPIVLMSSNGGTGTLSAASDVQTHSALASLNIIDYSIQELSGSNDWGLVSKIHTGTASAPIAGSLSFLSAVGVDYSSKDMVNLIATSDDKALRGRVWGRMSASNSKYNITATPSDAYSIVSNDNIDTDIVFVRIGADGSYKFPGGTSINFGVDGGNAKGDTKTQNLGSKTDYDMDYYGVHGNLESNFANFNFGVASYDLSLTPNAALSPNKAKAEGTMVNVGISKTLNVSGYQITPYADYFELTGGLNDLALGSNVGSLKFKDFDISSTKFGVNTSRRFNVDNVNVIPSFEIYYADDSSDTVFARFVPTGGANDVAIGISEIGEYTGIKAGVTLQFEKSGFEVFGRVNAISGSNVEALSTSVGASFRF